MNEKAVERAVQRRIRQERKEAAHELAQLDRARLQRSGGEQRAMHRLDVLVEDLRTRDASGKSIPSRKRDQVEEATAEVSRALRAVIDVADARAETLARIEQLESDGEFKRRFRDAKRVEALRERLQVEARDGYGLGSEAVELVLLLAGKPLHYTEITRRALEAGLIKTTAKEPKQTVSGYLVRGTEGDEPRFVRVEPGVFDLATRQTGAPA